MPFYALEDQPFAEPDTQRHATPGPHFILAQACPAAACRLARTLNQLVLPLFSKAVLACALLLPCCVLAQDESPISCTSPKNTLEINECAMREYKDRDRELNEAYRALGNSLGPGAAGDTTDYAAVRARLVAAQKAWVVFRDADCLALRKLYEEGTIRTAMQLGCLIERTVQRTKELQAWRAQ